MSHPHEPHATARRRTYPPVPAEVVAPVTLEPNTLPTTPDALAGRVTLDGALLDHLVGLVGELVLARNQLVRATTSADPNATGVAAQRVDLITTRLQEGLMRTRMQPLTALVAHLPDLADTCGATQGRAVQLHLEGDATELDKSVVAALREPIEQLVREWVMERVEEPATRARLGKPTVAHATLAARAQGGHVVLELRDDGPGRARREGELAALESTLSALGGRLEHEARASEGTIVRLVVPLTLAILSALTLEDGGERYAVPQSQLEEVVRPTSDPLRERLETLQGLTMFRLRGEMLPVTHLGRRLRGPDAAAAEPLHQRLLVLRTEAGRFGLVVDALLDTEELVVKPLPRRLQGLPYYAGAAVRGDGRVALILKVDALAEGHAHTPTLAPREVTTDDAPTIRMMLVRVRPGRMAAIPVDDVAHIARFPANALEHRGTLDLARDGQGALPVFTLAGATAVGDDWRPVETDRAFPVLVHEHDGQRVGYLVDAVEDIVRVPRDGHENGVLVRDVVHERCSLATLAPSATREVA